MTRAQASLDFALPPELVVTLEHCGDWGRTGVYVDRPAGAVRLVAGERTWRLSATNAGALACAIQMAVRRLEGGGR